MDRRPKEAAVQVDEEDGHEHIPVRPKGRQQTSHVLARALLG